MSNDGISIGIAYKYSDKIIEMAVEINGVWLLTTADKKLCPMPNIGMRTHSGLFYPIIKYADILSQCLSDETLTDREASVGYTALRYFSAEIEIDSVMNVIGELAVRTNCEQIDIENTIPDGFVKFANISIKANDKGISSTIHMLDTSITMDINDVGCAKYGMLSYIMKFANHINDEIPLIDNIVQLCYLRDEISKITRFITLKEWVNMEHKLNARIGELLCVK